MKKTLPEKTIQRLLLYYRYLYFISKQGTKDIYSKSLADLLEIRASQVRKDLSYLGKMGIRGAGYDVLELRHKIAEILGIEKEIKVCIVGMGNLGSALAAYRGLEALKFKIDAIFDNSKRKIGRKIKGLYCHDIKNLRQVIQEKNIELVILTVPAEGAQDIARTLQNCGIKSILNFAPVKLSLPRKIKVKNIDLALELKTLSYSLTKS